MADRQVRKKRRRTSESPVRKYWWLVPVLAGVAMIAWVATGPRWSRPPISTPAGKPVAGYIADTQQMLQEYARFYGKPPADSGIQRRFDDASLRVGARDYANAAALLEEVSKVAALPVVFNNLGVLYAAIHDSPRAVHAFREALARDMDYQAVRLNLDRMKDVLAVDARPVTQEAEPNNDINQANMIGLGKAVEGNIDASLNDVDFFRVTTPPAPPATLSIEITNHSTTLAPVVKVFDAEDRITEWGKVVREPGSGLTQTFAPSPNTTLYLQVSGDGSTGGRYALLVRSLKTPGPHQPN